jgi:pyruvate dehydrogenase E2 component (dihydrolipoyllysine-residue acetyltransferase)
MRDVHEVTMPKLGETVTEGTVGRWLKEVGQPVAFDDPLYEVSTDKVDSEIPSPYDGVLLEVLVRPGETVPVGTPLARIGDASAIGEGQHSPVDESVAPPQQDGPGEEHEVTMPKLGETVTEGTVGRWLKQVGDPVAFDDPLYEVSTDKVDSEIPSPYDGVLVEIIVQEGQTVPVGTPLARIGAPGSAPAGAPPSSTAAPSSAPVEATPPRASSAPAEATPAPARLAAPPVPVQRAGNGSGGTVLSPVVRRLLAERNLDPAQVPGTGGGGRITREDVLGAAPAAPQPTPQPTPQPAPQPTAPPIQQPAAAQRAPQPAAQPAARDARDEVVPASRIRMITAERMVESRRTAAHVWTSIEVDLERIAQLREKHKAAFRKAEGASLTYLPFIARAVCDALRAYPPLNCSFDLDARTITYHHYVNLGIAVDVTGLGLMAPVIKDADALNLRGLARAIRDVGNRAKERTLGSAEMTGSTFTISNPGPMGTYASAAVINQPNVAILTTEGVARRVVAVGDAIAIHHTCVLGLSYDHRALDGVVAAQFLAYLRDALQDRDWEAELA